MFIKRIYNFLPDFEVNLSSCLESEIPYVLKTLELKIKILISVPAE